MTKQIALLLLLLLTAPASRADQINVPPSVPAVVSGPGATATSPATRHAHSLTVDFSNNPAAWTSVPGLVALAGLSGNCASSSVLLGMPNCQVAASVGIATLSGWSGNGSGSVWNNNWQPVITYTMSWNAPVTPTTKRIWFGWSNTNRSGGMACKNQSGFGLYEVGVCYDAAANGSANWQIYTVINPTMTLVDSGVAATVSQNPTLYIYRVQMDLQTTAGSAIITMWSAPNTATLTWTKLFKQTQSIAGMPGINMGPIMTTQQGVADDTITALLGSIYIEYNQ